MRTRQQARRAARWYHGFYQVAGILSGIVVAFVTVVIFYEVIKRYALNAPTSWTLDFTRFVYVYGGMGAIAYATYRRAHIRVDILYDRFPRPLRRALDAAGLVAFLGFLAVLVWQSLSALAASLAYDQHHSGDLDWPLASTLAAVPLIGVLIAVPLCRQLWQVASPAADREPDDA
jgi:TRAP-type C4-dicarboxylate transport system permease small subunit